METMTDNELPNGRWMEILLAVLLAVLMGMVMCGCRSQRVTEHVVIEYRDSVVKEVRLDTVHVPVYIEVPPQVAEHVTPEDSSHLENDYAVSEAKVDSNGLLHHRLWTKPQRIEKEAEVVVATTETTVTHSEKESATEKKIVEVPRDYTWWDRTRFYIAYGAIAALALIAVLRWKKRFTP